jgi:hypothetical protein
MNWDSIVEKTLTVFFHWAAVASVYLFAKAGVSSSRKSDSPATTRSKAKGYIYAVITVAAISFFAAALLTSPSEQDENVGDFRPAALATYAMKILLVLFPTVLLGVRAAYAEDVKLTSEQRRRLRRELEGKEETSFLDSATQTAGICEYDPFNVSADAAYRIVSSYQELRTDYIDSADADTYRPISSLPSDKDTLKRCLQYVYRTELPMPDENALAFRDAYQFTAFFLDDRVAQAANLYGRAVRSGELKKERERKLRLAEQGKIAWRELAPDDPVGSLNLAEVLHQVTVEAENLLQEWEAFAESVTPPED